MAQDTASASRVKAAVGHHDAVKRVKEIGHNHLSVKLNDDGIIHHTELRDYLHELGWTVSGVSAGSTYMQPKNQLGL